MDWPLFCYLLVVVLLLRFGGRLQWPSTDSVNTVTAATVAILILWQLKAALHPLLPLHFLGITALTLMAGARGALVAASLLAVTNSLWHDTLPSLSLELLCLVVVPVLVSRSALFVVRALLPRHLFIYIFVAGFLGSALALSAGYGLRSLLLAHWGWVSWSQAVSQGIELLPLLAFPEALMNGMAVTLMAVYRPQWLATFDEQRFLR